MRYLGSAFAALVTLLGAAVGGQPLQAAEAANYAYVGTYTRDAPGGAGAAQSEGIYVAKVDQATGALELLQTVPSDNPSFVALSPDQRFLFAINEVADFEGKAVGSVEAYRIDQASGEIALINRQALPGPIPAHLVVDPSGKHLVVALYMGALLRGPADRRGRQPGRAHRRGDAAGQRPQPAAPGGAASARRRRSIRPAATSRPPISASTRSRSSSSRRASSPRSARSPRRRAPGRATSPSPRTARCSTSSTS